MHLFKSRRNVASRLRTLSRPTAAAFETLEQRALMSVSSLFGDNGSPALTSQVDPGAQAVELGVKFHSDVDGFVTGLRFYKGVGSPGLHVGSLWTASGTLLGRAAFYNESNSGWQQVTLDAPVHITANTTYVASYFAPNNNYAADPNYFSSNSVTSQHLTADQSAVTGAFDYPIFGTPAFPAQSSGSNYFVDVLFEDALKPTVTNVSAFDGDANGSWDANIFATVNVPLNAASVNGSTVQLKTPTDVVVPATVSYDAASKRIVVDPSAPLTIGATYVLNIQGLLAAEGGTASGKVETQIQAVESTTYSIWDNSIAPKFSSFDDSQSVELGVRFTSDLSGKVTGIRFLKGVGNEGTHVGNLWTSTGTLLASATFTGESGDGWQQVSFETPVDITPGQIYIASYLAPLGHYAADPFYFAGKGADKGPLHALPDGAVNAPNGLYAYSTARAFPTLGANATNYWVDPVFYRPPSNTAPVASASPVTVTEDGITAVVLGGNDAQTPTSQLSFKVLTLPGRGVLKLNGVPVAAGQAFTGAPAGLTYEPSAEADGAGTDSLTYTVTDPQGLSSGVTTLPITITTAVAERGVVLGADHVLRIGGTPGIDLITVSPVGNGKLRVTFGLTTVSENILASSVSEIRIWGRDGIDGIALINLSIKSTLNGGAGTDAIAGGEGDDLILGGLGDDALTGMGGNDVIVGGDGKDALLGMAGHDILIAGQIATSLSAGALRAMGVEWAATKTTSATEAAEADRAVTDDDNDILSGGTGSDWFIVSLGDKTLDFSRATGNADVITYVS